MRWDLGLKQFEISGRTNGASKGVLYFFFRFLYFWPFFIGLLLLGIIKDFPNGQIGLFLEQPLQLIRVDFPNGFVFGIVSSAYQIKRKRKVEIKEPKATTMCTLEKRGRVFLLTLTGDDEHRLNPTLIDAIQASLCRIQAESTPGSVLITTAEGKFFSNGFDLNWAKAAGSGFYDRLILMVSRFEQVMADLFSLPLPTIAAVSGHAAAAGFMLALSHDYVLMRKDRGVLYMSELDIGLPFPDSFMALMRSKIPAPAALRSIALRADKVTAAKAVEMGIIDSAHDSREETVAAALRLGEWLAEKKWKGDVYAGIRRAAFREVSVVLGLAEKVEKMVVAARL